MYLTGQAQIYADYKNKKVRELIDNVRQFN